MKLPAVVGTMLMVAAPTAVAQQTWDHCKTKVAPLIEEIGQKYYEKILEKAAQDNKNYGGLEIIMFQAKQAAAVHVLNSTSVSPYMSDETWAHCLVLWEREQKRHRQEQIDKRNREYQANEQRVAREQAQKKQECVSKGGEWKGRRLGGHHCSFMAKQLRRLEERDRQYEEAKAEKERKRQERLERTKRLQEEHRRRVERKRALREQRKRELQQMQQRKD